MDAFRDPKTAEHQDDNSAENENGGKSSESEYRYAIEFEVGLLLCRIYVCPSLCHVADGYIAEDEAYHDEIDEKECPNAASAFAESFVRIHFNFHDLILLILYNSAIVWRMFCVD